MCHVHKCYVVRGPRQTASQFSARMALSVKSQSVTSARSQSSYTSEQARRHFGRRRQAYLVLAGAISVVGQTSQILGPKRLEAVMLHHAVNHHVHLSLMQAV